MNLAMGTGAQWLGYCWIKKWETDPGDIFIIGSMPWSSVRLGEPHESSGRKQQIYSSPSRHSESPPANTMLRVWLLRENEKPGSAVKGLSNCLKFTSWGSPQGLILPVSYPSVHSTLVDHRWTKF